MTRENVKKLLPVLQAYAEGKTIQLHSFNDWVDKNELKFSNDPEYYRIKPEPEYEPFTTADWDLFLGKIIVINGSTLHRGSVVSVGRNTVNVVISDVSDRIEQSYTFKRAFEVIQFTGGAPFGKTKKS